ncbi:MAG: hypothetical protein ACFFE4_13350 [Candidatus Thorarchaeota archaeon]
MSPEFAFTKKGRVVCLTHSKRAIVSNIPTEVKERFTDREIEHYNLDVMSLQSCKACEHYKSHSCSIPKKELRKYMLKMKLGMYKCKFCGTSIRRLYNIIYSYKVKEKYNVILPLLCCSCVEMFRSGELRSLESSWLKLCLASMLLFFLTFTVIPMLGIVLFDLNAFITLSLFIPVSLMGAAFFISEIKGRLKLKKSLKNSEFLQILKKGELDKKEGANE